MPSMNSLVIRSTRHEIAAPEVRGDVGRIEQALVLGRLGIAQRVVDLHDRAAVPARQVGLAAGLAVALGGAVAGGFDRLALESVEIRTVEDVVRLCGIVSGDEP